MKVLGTNVIAGLGFALPFGIAGRLRKFRWKTADLTCSSLADEEEQISHHGGSGDASKHQGHVHSANSRVAYVVYSIGQSRSKPLLSAK